MNGIILLELIQTQGQAVHDIIIKGIHGIRAIDGQYADLAHDFFKYCCIHVCGSTYWLD